MSEKPPRTPGFDKAPGVSDEGHDPNTIANEDEKERIWRLRRELPKLLRELDDKERGRAGRFLPFVLIRSVVGDRGDRPLNVPFWESPDIWTAPGHPGASPDVPPDHGGTVTTGQPNTVYAHVWNLGRAPIAGVKVEYYWFDPSFSFDTAHAHLIGMTRVDLGPRSSAACHKLVKCPRPWTPQLVNQGHECLVARVSSIGDDLNPAHLWDPWADRHVAQRNISVVSVNTSIDALVSSLDANRAPGMRIQLLQVATQAELAIRIAAPHLKVDPKLDTRVLAELRPDGTLHAPDSSEIHPGGLPPIDRKWVAGAAHAQRSTRSATVVPTTLLKMTPAELGQRARPGLTPDQGARLRASPASVATLLQHERHLPVDARRIETLGPPAPGLAHPLRLVAYKGDQIVGGYTIVVGTRTSAK